MSWRRSSRAAARPERARSEIYATIAWLTVAALLLGLASVTAGHALLYKRDPRAQLSWVLGILLIPLMGPVAYWIFGVNRIRRLAEPKRSSQLPAASARPGPDVLTPGLLEAVGASRMGDLLNLGDRISRRPLTIGNRVTPLHNGEETYPAMLAAIERAEQSVTLCTYIFDGDDTGRRFVEAFRRAQRRGVEVRVLVDAIGEKYSTVSIFRWLTGVPAARFNPIRMLGRAAAYLNLRNHRKVLVVDGQLGFTGGMNIGDRHLADRHENPDRVIDMHFMVEGPVVGEMQEAFSEDWRFSTTETLEGERWFPEIAPGGRAVARAISDGPDEDFEKLQWMLMGALTCARKRVRIMTPYFIPSRPLISALATASLRGVRVEVVLPRQNNVRFVQWATTAFLWELLQNGVDIYLQPPPFVHTKLLVVDDVWSLIGSANLDPRSLRLNFELNLEVYDPGLAQTLGHHFDATVEVSHEVTSEELEAAPLGARLRNGLAKLFSPYL